MFSQHGAVSLLAVLFLLAPHASHAQCVVGESKLERTVAALACRSLKEIGIVRSAVSYVRKESVLNIAVFFEEGPALDVLADPNQQEIADSISALIRAADELAGTEQVRPTQTRFAVFSANPDDVRPRILYARAKPGGPVKLITATDGLLDRK